MHKILSLIIEAKKKQVNILNKTKSEIVSLAKKSTRVSIFKKSISNDEISIIAEIKQASPSKGILRKDLNPLEILKIYEQGKADAISVVTEEEFFLGKLKYLEIARENTALPILRKDFIIDEVQVYQSKAVGVDAILLIAKVLSQEKLKSLYFLAKDLGLDVVLEVHTLKELNRVLKIASDIIGINNRNLDTFEVDIKTTSNLMPFVPNNCIVISESGINSFKDILLLKGLEVDAVLVGEALMKSEDIMHKLKELHDGTQD